MEVTIVTTTAERDEMKRTVDGYLKVAENEIKRDEFLRNYPRKIWIDTELCQPHYNGMPFLVVDNRDGECFCENFATLDGAILYATDVYMIPEHQEDWDYMGAVRDGGDLLHRLEEGNDAPRETRTKGGSGMSRVHVLLRLDTSPNPMNGDSNIDRYEAKVFLSKGGAQAVMKAEHAALSRGTIWDSYCGDDEALVVTSEGLVKHWRIQPAEVAS